MGKLTANGGDAETEVAIAAALAAGGIEAEVVDVSPDGVSPDEIMISVSVDDDTSEGPIAEVLGQVCGGTWLRPHGAFDVEEDSEHAVGTWRREP